MAIFEFVLKFRLPDAGADSDAYMTALAEQGCTDAIVGVGQLGLIGLDFSREADSAHEAISSAITDVKHAIPDATLIEAVPDLVGLTEVADLLGFSRQYLRKVAWGHLESFPAPVHEGKPSLWHLYTVLQWVRLRRECPVEPVLVDTAKLTMGVNMVVGERQVDFDEVDELRALLQ